MNEPSYDPYPELDEQLDLLRAIDTLPERERMMIEARIEGKTFRQAGNLLDVTPTRAQQLYIAGVHHIRRFLGQTAIPANSEEGFWNYWRELAAQRLFAS